MLLHNDCHPSRRFPLAHEVAGNGNGNGNGVNRNGYGRCLPERQVIPVSGLFPGGSNLKLLIR
jgi:hypothetical protein